MLEPSRMGEYLVTMMSRRIFRRTGLLLGALLMIQVANAATFQNRYERAYHQFERGRYTQAIRDFRNLLHSDRTNDLSDNCQYWIGESYYQLGRYDQALIEFDRTLAFPKTNKREDALYKIALCHEELGEPTLAGELYVRFLADFPHSRHAPAVLKKLETLGLL